MARSSRTTVGEVAVVGASASGLYTALLLAREGVAVTVYERSTSVDPAGRALIVTSALRDYLGSLAAGAIRSEVDRYELYANGKVGEVRLGRPDLVIERSLLIHELATRAEAAGVRFRFGRRFTRLHPEHLSLDFASEGGDIERVRADAIVGADGATSGVARSAGWQAQQTVPLLQAIVTQPEDLASYTSRVWFVPDDTPYFYWLIPETQGRAAVGVIGQNPSHLRERFDRFLERHEMEPLEYQGARIPRYSRWTRVHKRLTGGDVYLVGDAAGQVKVSTVGGLVTGFRGAIGVAEAILGRPSGRTLRSLRRELDTHLLVRRVIHGFGESDYCRLLDLLNDPTRASLHRHTRDDAAAMLWRLAIDQPRFVPMSLRALLPRPLRAAVRVG